VRTTPKLVLILKQPSSRIGKYWKRHHKPFHHNPKGATMCVTRGNVPTAIGRMTDTVRTAFGRAAARTGRSATSLINEANRRGITSVNQIRRLGR